MRHRWFTGRYMLVGVVMEGSGCSNDGCSGIYLHVAQLHFALGMYFI